MKTSVKKWGNSAAVRIPSAVLEATQVQIDEEVEIREEAGKIIIEPVRKKAYNLADLVQGITKDNIHSAVDFGKAEGKEAW